MDHRILDLPEDASAQAPDAPLGTRHPTDDDEVNGVRPSRIVDVKDVTDIVELVRFSCSRHDPVVVRGGGTLLSIGNAPRALGSIVSMERMDRLLAYAPEDMVVTVEAGMTLAALDRHLAAAGQRVALEVPKPHLATIGGIAAANFNTGCGYGCGYPRDQILGMTVVDGNARVLRAGGRVVKNVAGYDMPRLFIGSFGTLAVIADLTLKTQPRPTSRVNLELDFTDTASLEDVRQALFSGRLPLRSLDIYADPDGDDVRWRMRVCAEGDVKQVAYIREAIAATSREAAARVEDCEEVEPRVSANFVARFALSPSRAVLETSTLLSMVRAGVETVWAVLESGGATLRLYSACRSAAECASLVMACQKRCLAGIGALVFERLPPEQGHFIDVWQGPVRGVELMRRIKQRFDPQLILAPGRFVGGI